MTRDDIIRMARMAGFGVLLPSVDGQGEIYAGGDVYTDEMERFADLVAAAEREECARLVQGTWVSGRTIVVKAIRARGGV
jgi:hypothetical protein